MEAETNIFIVSLRETFLREKLPFCEVIYDEKDIGSFTAFDLYAWLWEWLLVKASVGQYGRDTKSLRLCRRAVAWRGVE